MGYNELEGTHICFDKLDIEWLNTFVSKTKNILNFDCIYTADSFVFNFKKIYNDTNSTYWINVNNPKLAFNDMEILPVFIEILGSDANILSYLRPYVDNMVNNLKYNPNYYEDYFFDTNIIYYKDVIL
jgi:hypothetical protein